MRWGGWLARALALAWIAAALGCAMISGSSRSTSKAMDSSSDSSSEDPSDVMYMNKIRDYAYGYAKAGGDPQAFARGVGALAQRRGIHDGEDDEDTCRAIGEGFRDAGLGKSATHRAAVSIVQLDTKCGFNIRAGYHER